MKGPMRNSAFSIEPRRRINLIDLIENPLFSNMIRGFLLVVLGLGGYIWKVEMAHLNQTLSTIRAELAESNRRQWAETTQIKQEVGRLGGEVNRVLEHTNQLLFEALQKRPPHEARTPRTPRTPPARRPAPH